MYYTIAWILSDIAAQVHEYRLDWQASSKDISPIMSACAHCHSGMLQLIRQPRMGVWDGWTLPKPKPHSRLLNLLPSPTTP